MAVLLTDDFNRTASTTVLGGPVTGGPYTVRVGTWGVIGNQAYTSASVANSHVTFPAAVDVDIQATIPVQGNSLGLIVRWVDASNFWYFGWQISTWALLRNTAGTLQQFSTSSPVPVNGDVLRCIAYGRSLYGFVNGRLMCWCEDQFFSAATATSGFRINSNTTLRIDDLTASDAVGIPGDGGTATMRDDVASFIASSDYDPVGAVYKGRDSAAADAGSVA